MKTKFYVIIVIALVVLGSSCVSQKKHREQISNYEKLKTLNDESQSALKKCEDINSDLNKQILELGKKLTDNEKENEFLKSTNDLALNQLEALSVISSSQAESIKKSMDNLGLKDAYIQGLQSTIAYKDSINMALVMNLKGAIGNIEDEDVNIKVDKGVVFIDISDKLLFKSGSYNITDKAKIVLGKVAMVLKNQSHMEFMVEGHTDSIPYKSKGDLIDNWDLSVKRATTIVRLLQNEYGLNPEKMTAAGRGEYLPVATNQNADSRALNRRTRIVILPELDQFFELLESK